MSEEEKRQTLLCAAPRKNCFSPESFLKRLKPPGINDTRGCSVTAGNNPPDKTSDTRGRTPTKTPAPALVHQQLQKPGAHRSGSDLDIPFRGREYAAPVAFPVTTGTTDLSES